MSIGNVIQAIGAAAQSSSLKARLSAGTSVSQNNPIPFDVTDFSIGSDITSDGAGTFTLKAGKTYKLTAYPRHDGGSVNTNQAWYNVTDATQFPSTAVTPAANFNGGFSGHGAIEEYITAVADTDVQFRQTSTSAITYSGGAGGAYITIDVVAG